jgi:ParB/RepB/Spo0J family partition protein
MAKELAESRSKVYSVPIRQITSNTNPRQALSAELDKQGWKVFDGEKAVWPLATSDDQAERAKYVELIKEFDPEIEAMAATMLTQGQMQAVEVREGGSGKFTLVFGCRRCLAILYNWCLLGKPKEPMVNATMEKGNSVRLLQRALVENVRKNQSPLEEATTIRMLINNGQQPSEVANELGYSIGTINNRLALLDLDPKVQKRIKDGSLTATAALAEKNGNGHPKQKIRSRKEIEEAAEEFIVGTPQRSVLDWLLCRTEKIK